MIKKTMKDDGPEKDACAIIAMDTGKLPFKFDEVEGRLVHDALIQELKHFAKQGITHFLGDLSHCLGLWAALCILDMKEKSPSVTLSIFIPYIGQSKHWSALHRQQYDHCIREVLYHNLPSKKYTRECVSKNHQMMIDIADYVLFITTESDRVIRKAIAYARKLGIYIVIIDPLTLERSVEMPDFID